jgi:hypothetical protein
VAQANGWKNTPKSAPASARSMPRGGTRSLKDALSEAGFDEAPTLRHRNRGPDDGRDGPSSHSRGSSAYEPASGIAGITTEAPEVTVASRLYAPSQAKAPLMRPVPTASSVVSPPPWLRAKRRGRLEARMVNTFGWLMTIVVAGSIIGLAGRYLVVAPGDGVHMQARQ